MRKLNYEVVNEEDYTDFSERYEVFGMSGKQMVMTTIATAGAVAAYGLTRSKTNIPIEVATTPQITPQIEPLYEPVNVLTTPTLTPVTFNGGNPEMIQTGLIADTSLNMIANVLDPVIQILVAFSLPVASVIMVGACFLFMFNNSEKAWTMIMNAGLGYILINLSPLFLEVLRQIGKAI